jgi:hypothetical protein
MSGEAEPSLTSGGKAVTKRLSEKKTFGTCYAKTQIAETKARKRE